MVGEHAQPALPVRRWKDVAATERTDDERRGRRFARILVEQLVEPLGLPFVVAEDDRRDLVAHDATQPLDVAVDRLGRPEREDEVRLLRCRVDEPHRAERGERRARGLGRLEQLLACIGILAAPAGEIDVVRRFIPRPLKLRDEMRARGIDEERVGREQRGDGETLTRRRFLAHLTVHRQDDGEIDRARRALRGEVEVTEIDDFVAPELEAHGIGHAERVDVEDAAAETELGDVLHHRHTLEADALEMRRELGRTAHVALPQLDAQVLERAGQSRALEQRARRREEHANLAATQALEGLDTFAGNLHVRLDLAEPFARRIQADRRLVDQRVQVGEQPLGERDAVGDDDEEACRQPPRECSDECRIRRAGKARRTELSTRRGQRVDHTGERRKALDRVEQTWK